MTIPITATISEDDYCALEDALQSSEKGRRFLRAYVDRNRGLDSLRLLRSISRLHRAALGAPGPHAEISRDLTSMLKSISKQRQKASDCDDEMARSAVLAGALEEIEASLIALVESLEERDVETPHDGPSIFMLPGAGDVSSADRTAKLFGELSSFFSAEPQ
jgi:hypothetical protein